MLPHLTSHGSVVKSYTSPMLRTQVLAQSILTAGLVLVLHIFYVTDAKASLGGPLESIESDQKALQGKLSEIVIPQERNIQKRFSEHLIQRDGSEVREFALLDGTVFAVTWNGPTQPDLSVLLGSYYEEYQDTLSSLQRSGSQRSNGRVAQRRGHSARVIRSKNLVIERSGHMRDIRGKAYLPQLMPDGVGPKDLHG